VDVNVDSLHVKRIIIEDLVDYIYIVKVDNSNNIFARICLPHAHNLKVKIFFEMF
jgi:hypothetical protein